jgi:hypothetical protein
MQNEKQKELEAIKGSQSVRTTEEGKTKGCSKCKTVKELDGFYNDNYRPDGKYPQCKECVLASPSRDWSLKHPERCKANREKRYLEHPEKVEQAKISGLRWYSKNRDSILKKGAIRRAAKDPAIKAADAENQRIKNKANPNFRTVINKRQKLRRVKDPNFRLATNLRARMGRAIKNNLRAGSAVKDCGCSMEFLKAYLEARFQPGMAWNNWGQYGWHIDHIIPLSWFNLTNREQFLTACHYSNLQPLWWYENLEKHDRIE